MTVAANVNQCLSTLKGIDAQLSSLALHSQDDMSKRTFHEVMLELDKVKKDLQTRITELELAEPQYKKT